jgi:DNA-binding MarR family transcriptional regulator
VTEGIGGNAKRRVSRRGIPPYDSLPEGVRDRPDFLIHHIYILSRAWVRQAQDMREFDVNIRERLLLEMLSYKELPQHVILAHLDIQPTVNTKLIDKLEKRQLVERRVNPVNRKENLVSLTDPYGRDFVRRMLEVTDAKIERIRTALPDGALLDFTRLASRVITEMEKDALSANLTAARENSTEVTNV